MLRKSSVRAGLVVATSFILALLWIQNAFAGSATVSWDPPTTNTNGTVLTDLAGYKIYYGTQSGVYSNTIDIGNVTSYSINNLSDGRIYYFAVTSYNTARTESIVSSEVSKAMPAPANYSLAITKTGTGSGTVTSSPAGIYCGSTCSATYASGSLITLTAAPAADSLFAGWSGACTGTGSCTVTLSTASSVSAAFRLKTYTITPSAGTGGALSPASVVSVSSGGNQSFTITPSAGYRIADVKVDGSSIGQVSTHTFTNVTANHTISASFNLATYTITATAGPGGSLSPSGTISANYGSTGIFAISPSVDYRIESVIVDNVSVGAVSTYTFQNITANHSITATFAARQPSPDQALSCTDPGIPCVSRGDGGSDADNLVSSNPKNGLDYVFSIIVKNTTGIPRQVTLHLSQRSSPAMADFASYAMDCSGSFSEGATCTYRTKLGPVGLHTFYFDAIMSDGTTLARFPETVFLKGPNVQLVNGYNLVGIPRDINDAGLDGQAATGSATTYRLNPAGNAYSKVTSSKPAKAGEGYYSYKATPSLPELKAYADIKEAAYIISIEKGWNVISNPFIKNVRLRDVTVLRNGVPATWEEATANGWLVNGLYSFSGSDWGGTYSIESGQTALLTPWMGYLIYVNKNDAAYSLTISKP